jgi:flagellar protein FlaG
MEITGIIGQGNPQRPAPGEQKAQRLPTLGDQAAAGAHKHLSSSGSTNSVDINALVDDLQVVTSTLDKRLKFSINRELDQVVVKVIDRHTDKVIKELPPEEIQRLHVRLREAIGLLIDEQI